MKNPVTSVLMPAYGTEATLRRAAESVLAQTEPALELIVVDDAGPVPAADTLAGIDDPRLRLVRHRRNRGTAAARNTALELARAPLVSQLDADDQWERDYLEAIAPCFGDPEVGLAYSNTHIDGHPDGHDDYIRDPSVHPMDTFPEFAEGCPIPALTATMRTDAVRRVGGYARWLWSATDYQLYAKLIAAGWRFAYVDRQLARYSWPTEARAKSFQAERQEREVLKLWLAFVARHPLTPGPRRQVRRRLGRELRRIASAE